MLKAKAESKRRARCDRRSAGMTVWSGTIARNLVLRMYHLRLHSPTTGRQGTEYPSSPQPTSPQPTETYSTSTGGAFV
jgi:hypothetical protein